MSESEDLRILAEDIVDYCNAVEAACVKLKMQIDRNFGPEPEQKKPLAAVSEETFNILKFEPQQGAKIGDFEVAYKPNNIEDKWTHAYNVLRNSNATIQSRYHGEGYQFSYWLYGENKIYRQKLTPKT